MKNIKGYQISYPMTSKDTIDDPTEVERSIFETFGNLRDLVANCLKNKTFQNASTATLNS